MPGASPGGTALGHLMAPFPRPALRTNLGGERREEREVKKQDKNDFVDWMKAELATATSMVVADYRGLTVAQMSALRLKCRDSGVKFKVAKNTLMKVALKDSNLAGIEALLTGPTAVAWSSEDPGAPARVLLEFLKDKAHEKMKIKGAGVAGRKLSAEEVKSVLSVIPTRPQLLGQLAGMMNSGPQKLHGVLSAGPAKLGYALAALKQSKESGQAAA
jgi:large subunit ribosomal protein L10